MAAKVIPFPKQIESPGEELDRHIRAYLAEMDTDKEFINHVSQRMKSFIEQYASKSFEPTLNLVVPPNLSREQADALVVSIDTGIQNTIEDIQDMMRKIVLERLHLEIEIYSNLRKLTYGRC